MLMAVKIKFTLLLVISTLFMVKAQSFQDCSFYYSISTEDKKGIELQPETYRLYYNNLDINPYITRVPNGKKPAEKGESYTLFQKDSSLYMTHKMGKDITTLKLASFRQGDTIAIDDEYDYPMMLFLFGERSVLSSVEKVAVFGYTIDAYVIKFIQDKNNYTYLYLHKENLLPLKYEVIQANTKKNIIKNKIIVQIERAAGQYINGLAEFSVLGPVYAGAPELKPN